MRKQAKQEQPFMDPGSATSNMSLLIIAGAFLLVTVILVLLKPGNDAAPGQALQSATPQSVAEQLALAAVDDEPDLLQPSLAPAVVPETAPVAQAAPSPATPAPFPAAPQSVPTLHAAIPQTETLPQVSAVAPVPAPAPLPSVRQPVPVETEVTRTEIPLLSIAPKPLELAEPTSAFLARQLRQPIRLTSTATRPRNLSSLTDEVLVNLSAPTFADVDPRFKALLVQSINERQSDTYIQVLLDTASARNAIQIPTGIRTTGGKIDSAALLAAMVQTAGGQLPGPSIPLQRTGTYVVQPGDSLAGIANRYYGRPMEFVKILDANPRLFRGQSDLNPGQELTIPAG